MRISALLSLAAALAASPAGAQTFRATLPSQGRAPAWTVTPLPGSLRTPLAPLASLSAAPRLISTLPGAMAAPRISGVMAAPSLPGTEAAPAPALGAGIVASLESASAEIGQSLKAPEPFAASAPLGKLFDKNLPGGDRTVDFRPPNPGEDRRINAALQALSRSSIGLNVYKLVYEKYRGGLTLHIDDAPGADYDARVSFQDGRPRIDLTLSLINRASPEAAAAYIGREMSDLYYGDIPASAERGYLAYGNMVRIFAELTNSDLNAYGNAWDQAKDQNSGGVFVIQRYYGSWKAAVRAAERGGDIRETDFFRFLRTTDDSNTEARSKLSLREQYQRGMIDYETYRQMTNYFNERVSGEARWLERTGR